MRFTLSLGRRGERTAARYLKKHAGHRIIAINHRGPAGEIDLITQDGDTVVFVEVKTKQSDEAGDPLEAVTPAKMRQIERCARHFLMVRGWSAPCRFDVVGVVCPAKGRPQIEHFANAFAAQGF